ncbi:O-linked N-acetylglucosamine transferase, SPINDLY family protein [Azospirillum rugosum]|uniref:protein O-GlcNAc transferase n=1 Tax=Azospirillum rugosum TaxID=416170 RepID=A0ABS4SKP8_9PROT|nr:glycosyltransferase family 41 protein [Azospirillum rugosum]MBP2291985.1 putative O-linked N-acetylglucosamine transferase (SPINDLY family) [Azospirillum rugosum]MDQ0525879.1 putative O-linked N-acetylglucosamine transferase (SPINDLY family) [Azospirillum rugosum]
MTEPAAPPSAEPIFAEGHNALAAWLWAHGRADEAVAAWRRSVDLLPGFAEAHHNLALAYWTMSRLDEAVGEQRAAVRSAPGMAEAHANLGALLLSVGRPAEAAAALRRALALVPGDATALANLALAGVSPSRPGAVDPAAARRAALADPELAEAHARLGDSLSQATRLEDAACAYRRALALSPALAEVWANLGFVRQSQGDLDGAESGYRRALALDPGAMVVGSNLAYLGIFRPDVTPARVLDAHAAWDARHGRPLAASWRPHANARDPERRPVVGILSGDFRDHPAGRFAIRGVEALAAQGFDLLLYANQTEEDGYTRRFRDAARQFRHVMDRTDAELADLIRADRIDVLIDLAGHNARGRPGLFARRPAPVQVAWAGYMATTGMAAMDALLADRHHVPEGAERFYRERILRLPDAFIAWDPPAGAADPGPPPCRTGGPVTFGAFNIVTKLNDGVLATWAAVMGRVPGARLLVKTTALSCPATAALWRARFAAFGIAPHRLTFRGGTGTMEHMAAIAGVDVALDPFPFSGSTTTLETLWMGVPVITLSGETFASRHSLAFQRTAGLDGMAARDRDQYVDLAVAWATDRDRLAAFRREARARMAASPLCDGERFGRGLAELLHAEWRRWCEAA